MRIFPWGSLVAGAVTGALFSILMYGLLAFASAMPS